MAVDSNEGRTFGPGLMVLGILVLVFSWDIPRSGIGGNEDPGPAAFPIALALFFIGGGLVETVKSWVRRRSEPVSTPQGSFWSGALEVFTSSRNRDLLAVLAGLTVYIVALPWLGFSICTFLFAVGMMLRLGTRWPVAWATAAILVLVVHVLFVSLFRVQLPRGVFDWPF